MTITWTDFQPHPGDTNGAETAFTAANGGEGEGNRTSLGVREDNLREDKSFSSFFFVFPEDVELQGFFFFFLK